ncbi:MAG: DUF4145 domain-containing protein [Acidobacteriota bacterium]|nr:DUF4145 domain-containing protein [Acidobacteriota bacterium]
MHAEHHGMGFLYHAIMQCQGCQKFILGIIERPREGEWKYYHHYPLGMPDDSVAKEVSAADPGIALDFSEALRCLWIKSYKAAVAMCRRSVEASCKQQGAKGKDLQKKIDDLAAQGKITEPLRQMAHAVRLTANRHLHGKKNPAELGDIEAGEIPADDLDTFNEDDAKAMIAFTKEYFHHVYVMPALLEAYKPKTPTPVNTK